MPDAKVEGKDMAQPAEKMDKAAKASNASKENERTRTGLSVEALKRAITDNLFYTQGRFHDVATPYDHYMALAYAVRDRLLHRWIGTAKTAKNTKARTVCYLSAEFLMGPQLGNNLINLDIYDQVKEAVEGLGLDLDELIEQEEEPGLGNGGLGRLAACYLDSLSTLQIPAIGYGILYEYGIFDQKIEDGWQIELTDKWMRYGSPWGIIRPKIGFSVKFGGHTEGYKDEHGRYRVKWVPSSVVNGIADDYPVLGYKVNNANLLRLWRSQACESFDFQAFNVGDYYGAVNEKVIAENITKVLYPNDEPEAGKELRLKQQYFFVSCSLQDMIRIFLQMEADLTRFNEKYVIQLNDTHPSIAVAELMRLLVDEHGMNWATAWDLTRKTFAYTNHTLLPEALEKWPVLLFKSVLPRHLEIIYEINQRFLDDVRIRFPGDNDRLSRMSLIDDSGDKYVRMANLACVGSYAVNGVAALHTELLKDGVLADFFQMWPEKFSNKTNGVTPRRFIVHSNPGLSNLITGKIGDGWVCDLYQLKKLEKLADDAGFHQDWRTVKRAAKETLASYIKKKTWIDVDPDSLFDIQVKRIHEYKRQHLNVLHIINLYNRLKQDPNVDMPPRTFVFGGKAAPGYFMAKLIIKLINSVGYMVNRDPAVRDRLKVVFVPDFNVKNARHIYPAADLSEQISTAGKEASGTGNMKFSMNGALTIGTLDGANVEIREEVGEENFFLFGLTAQQVVELKTRGYRPHDFYQDNHELREVIDLVSSGFFSHGDSDLFKPLVDSLLHHDEYLVMADFQSYVDCQKDVSQAYGNAEQWTRMSILNVARMGKFSSDRAIREYCEDIWKAPPMAVDL